VDRDASAGFTAITEVDTAYSGLKCVYLYRTGQVNGSFHNVLFPPCQKIPLEDCFTLGERQPSGLEHLGQRKVSTRKNAGFPEGETMPFPCRSAPPIPSPPSLALPRSKAHTFDILVVFSTTGDLIRVHSYGDHCSATWEPPLAWMRSGQAAPNTDASSPSELPEEDRNGPQACDHDPHLGARSTDTRQVYTGSLLPARKEAEHDPRDALTHELG
jgi:hypothetical protein